MYLQGTLAIDPSQLTQVVRKKPTKAFKKLLYLLTAGVISDKMEHETFCAISILQQLNTAFRSLGLTNIVHLAKDEITFYLDEHGLEDDLRTALDHFKLEVDAVESRAFQTLKLVLEHEDDLLKYLISVQIERIHKPGTYPIHVEVDGLIKRFRAHQGESPESLRNRIASELPDSEAHERLLLRMQDHFELFLGHLGLALKSFIGVDSLVQHAKKTLIRPRAPVSDREQLPFHSQAARPALCGYAGASDLMLYTLVWSSLAHSHNWHIADCTVVDEAGSTLMSVGAQGFDAATSSALDPEAAFELPSGADVSPGETDQSARDDGDGGSWFGGDSGNSGDSGGDSSGDSGCSSCSSGCGSCGGGD